jgi:hypothetical protein
MSRRVFAAQRGDRFPETVTMADLYRMLEALA